LGPPSVWVRGGARGVHAGGKSGGADEWGGDRGTGVVARGHTRDDDAETVLMGLSRAAGIGGLSGMRRQFDAGDIRVHRPLLGAGREELRDWLRGRGIAWVDDPTNENERFTRVRARKVLAALRPLGITADGLAEVAGNLARAQGAVVRKV